MSDFFCFICLRHAANVALHSSDRISSCHWQPYDWNDSMENQWMERNFTCISVQLLSHCNYFKRKTIRAARGMANLESMKIGIAFASAKLSVSMANSFLMVSIHSHAHTRSATFRASQFSCYRASADGQRERGRESFSSENWIKFTLAGTKIRLPRFS